MSTTVSGETMVADVTRDPRALDVLKRLGINHCCGAHLSLREAAATAGVSLADLLRALEGAYAHLEARGFSHETDEPASGVARVRIWRQQAGT